jgi:hypothetical protein
MEGLQGYGSDLSDDSAPAAPTAPEMEVEMLIAQKPRREQPEQRPRR